MGHIIDNAAPRGVTLFSFGPLQNSYTQCCFLGEPHLLPSRDTTLPKNTWNCCHLGKPHLLPSRTDSATPKELFFASHIDAVVVDGGPDFLVFQCYSMTTESFVTYFPRNLKNPHLFYRYGRVPLGTHFVGVKQCKREHRFRLLGHIPHALVDDGALCPFSLSEKETTSVH